MTTCPFWCYLFQKNTPTYSKTFYFWYLRCEKDSQRSGYNWSIHWTSWSVRNNRGSWTDGFKSKSAHEIQWSQNFPISGNPLQTKNEKLIPVFLKQDLIISICHKDKHTFPKTEVKHADKGLQTHGSRTRRTYISLDVLLDTKQNYL